MESNSSQFGTSPSLAGDNNQPRDAVPNKKDRAGNLVCYHMPAGRPVTPGRVQLAMMNLYCILMNVT